MTEKDTTDWARVAAYMSGELPPAELERVEGEIRSNPEVWQLVEQLNPTWSKSVSRENYDVDAALDNIRAIVGSPIVQSGRTMELAGRFRPMMVAMVAIIAIMAAVQWGGLRTTPTITSITKVYSTRRAQRANVTLPDGSHAVLAPETKLVYTANGDTRTVDLNGQAYFTVEHSSKNSFTVNASGVTTRVLGTSFSVRAYADDRAAQVAVAEGKVSILGNTVLLAGDVGQVEPGKQPVITHDAKVVDVFGWTRGLLSFDGVPLIDVTRELERAYDLDIKISDASLGKQLITLKLADKSATDMIEALSIAVDAKVQRNGRNVVFSPRER